MPSRDVRSRPRTLSICIEIADALPPPPAGTSMESRVDRRRPRRGRNALAPGSHLTTCFSTNSFPCAAATVSNSTSATTATPSTGSTALCNPKHSDAELSEYERFGEVAYMDHKMQ